MTLGERCDEIVRLIDEAIGEAGRSEHGLIDGAPGCIPDSDTAPMSPKRQESWSGKSLKR